MGNSWADCKSKKKNCHCEVSSLIPCNSNEPFLNWIVTWDEKWIVYDNWWWSAQWLDQEEVPKPNLYQQKVIVTVWWSVACLNHYSFQNPRETITSRKLAQKINEKQWKLPPQQPALVNRKGPILHNTWLWHHTTNPSGVEWIGLRSFASSAVFTWPLASWLPLLQAPQQLFAGKMLPQPAGGRICFPRVCWILKHGFFKL